MFQKISKIKESEEGFTLAELIVAMSIFIIATAVISGIFIRTVKTQRQTNQLMTINSDAGLIMERITREVREGYDFVEPASSGVCSTNLVFSREIEGSQREISYRLNNNDIERKQGSSGSFGVLNSPNHSVNDLCFLKTQGTADDPWRITIIMRTGSTDPNIDYSSDIQSTVTARVLPCEADPDQSCPYE